MSQLRLGGYIDAWCSKCKLMLGHTIQRIDDGVVKNVQCDTCKAEHQYKANPPKSAAASTGKSKTSKSQSSTAIRKADGSISTDAEAKPAKAPKAPKAPKATTTGAAKKGTKAAAKAPVEIPVDPEFTRLMNGRDTSTARTYSPHSLFNKNEVVAHPVFGMGLVMAAQNDDKIQILFSNGPRLLVHNRGRVG